MCKLFGISDLGGGNRALLEATLLAAKTQFTNEKDGFGYAVRTSRGIYAERYVNPKDFTGVRSGRVLTKALHPIKQAVELEYESTRTLGKITGGLIVHGRQATHGVGLDSTHPFTKSGWALAHNGIVDYDGPERPKRGECDSEDILNSFIHGKGLRELEKYYAGYAAVLALPKHGGFIAYRDDRATLYVSKLEGTEAFAFATTSAHLSTILGKAKLHGTTPVPLRDEHAVMFDVDNKPTVERYASPGYRITSHSEGLATGYTSAYNGNGRSYNNGLTRSTYSTAAASATPKKAIGFQSNNGTKPKPVTQTTFPDYEPASAIVSEEVVTAYDPDLLDEEDWNVCHGD